MMDMMPSMEQMQSSKQFIIMSMTKVFKNLYSPMSLVTANKMMKLCPMRILKPWKREIIHLTLTLLKDATSVFSGVMVHPVGIP